MTLTPAYGRDYKSQKAVKVDFDADKDFIVADFMHPSCGSYANKSDLEGEYKEIYIRYHDLRKIMVIKL
jgi:hypothetical protein